MAHGMASTKKFVGASATYAAAAEFLFRGYNIALSEFDMGRADDLLCFAPGTSKVFRFQVRSKQVSASASSGGAESAQIYFPIEIVHTDSDLDFVIMALRFHSAWLLGLFDGQYVARLMASNVGSITEHVGQQTYDLRARVEARGATILFSGLNVSDAFLKHPSSAWDAHFPNRARNKA